MGVSVSYVKMILISCGLHSMLVKDGMVNEQKLEEVRASAFVENDVFDSCNVSTV